MISGLLLVAAVAMPLGAWPTDSGPAELVVDEVEFYIVEPETSYGIIAVQTLTPMVKKVELSEVRRLVALAHKLGASAVLLLGEVSEKAIPSDPQEELPTTGRYAVAVFLVFDEATGWESEDKGTRRSALPARPPGNHREHVRAQLNKRQATDRAPRFLSPLAGFSEGSPTLATGEREH